MKALNYLNSSCGKFVPGDHLLGSRDLVQNGNHQTGLSELRLHVVFLVQVWRAILFIYLHLMFQKANSKPPPSHRVQTELCGSDSYLLSLTRTELLQCKYCAYHPADITVIKGENYPSGD